MLTTKFGRICKFQKLKWPYLVFFPDDIALLGCISAIIDDFDVSCSPSVFTVDVLFVVKPGC